MKLSEFTVEVQEQVKSTLKAYDSCSITRSNGKYTVGTGTCIKTDYAEDHTVYRFNKDDVYSEKEQILNYVNEFKSYPIEYNAKVNYENLKLLDGVNTYINEDYHAIFVKDDVVVVKK